MKIVQALGWYYPESLGGTEVYVAGLSRRLRRGGHEVLIAAPDPQRNDERTYEYDGSCVYRYPIPSLPTRPESQGAVPVRGAERFHTWLKRQRPDVVHLHTFVTGLGLHEVQAAKASGARVIVTTHSSSLGYVCQRGTMMRWGESLCDGVCESVKCAACALHDRGLSKPLARLVAVLPLSFSRLAGRLPGKLGTTVGMGDLIARNQAAQRRMLVMVDAFVVLTRWAFDVLLANGAPHEKIVLNRLGMSWEQVTRKPPPEMQPTRPPVRVGYLGRVDPVKGVYDLARAVASLPRDLAVCVEFRGPVSIDVGKRHLDELRRLVVGDPRVTFSPPVSEADAASVIAGYDVLCCPAVCAEGGPTVAIEALAVGTPVVGTRIGGLAELITDGVNGRLVAPGDWRALASVLRELATNPATTIDAWRRVLPPARTMDEVAADYLALYAA
jgi:glycosyltransferase involved in cell wall biosynthesis